NEAAGQNPVIELDVWPCDRAHAADPQHRQDQPQPKQSARNSQCHVGDRPLQTIHNASWSKEPYEWNFDNLLGGLNSLDVVAYAHSCIGVGFGIDDLALPR